MRFAFCAGQVADCGGTRSSAVFIQRGAKEGICALLFSDEEGTSGGSDGGPKAV